PEGLLQEGPAQERFASFQAVLPHLRSGSIDAPYPIATDDAHLPDSASLLLVRFLVRERGLALLMLLTRRDRAPEAAPEVRGLLSELDPAALAIPLSGLSEAAVSEYLASFNAPPPDPGLLHAVVAVTKGNPLHLRSIALRSDLRAGGVSGGLERAIRGVIERLPPRDRRLIAFAALLGREVTAYETARMADVSPTLAAETLVRAADLGLAVRSETDRFRFVHDLIRDVVTASLDVSDRLAARTAEKEQNPVALARAALGLGGVWVGEHRLTHDAERVLALQRRALEALPVEGAVLRARLTVRLAAEEAYRGGSVSAVLAAVEEVRRAGDGHALAEALSLAHHALLTPEHTWRRPAIAKELIALAAAAEDGLLSLIG